MARRDFRIDNIKWILIVLVVFGHLIEQMGGDAARFLYFVIYTFHMPAFVFITGYFAKLKARRIGVLALSYVVFQTLYCLTDWALAAADASGAAGTGANATLHLQYLTPRWIVWYLLAVLAWTLIIPLIRTDSRRRMAVTLAASIVVALAVGFFDGIGRFLSLSRIFAFAPFFIAGFYARHLVLDRQKRLQEAGATDAVLAAGWVAGAPGVRCRLLVAGVIAAVLTCLLAAFGGFEASCLYNAQSYASTGGSLVLRLTAMLLAAGWICLLFAAVPARRVRVLTNSGAHTMPVYVLHGFVVLVMRAYLPMTACDPASLLLAFALAVALVFALGNEPLDKAVRFGL